MNREDKISYMFDEIGRIDDRYVNEALLEEGRSSKRARVVKILLIAACAALVMTVALASFAKLSQTLKFISDDRGNVDEGVDDPYPDDQLCQIMSELDAAQMSHFQIDESIEQIIHDDSVRLIWTYDGLVYYSVSVDNKYDRQRLSHYMSYDRSEAAEVGEYGSDFRFWISYGNGVTETPYLENNGGRISLGSLSDYLPEIYPSSEFAAFIGELVENDMQQ